MPGEPRTFSRAPGSTRLAATSPPMHDHSVITSRGARFALLLCLAVGCRCSRMESEVDGLAFLRCAQAAPPAEQTARVGALTLTVKKRVLEIAGPTPLAVAAFTGPVGGALGAHELTRLGRAKPELALYLGGLGDDLPTAQRNLAALAKLRIPTLFVAGGGDRLPVVEGAFETLEPAARAYLLHASGLREIRVGEDRLIVVAGAPLGRYALDEQACGFTVDDLEDIEHAASDGSAARTWLLSWYAPAGFGVSEGLLGTEIGSPELHALARTLGAQGGIFGQPDVRAERSARQGATRWWGVPRLGRTGSLRADGTRLAPGFAQLSFDGRGVSQRQ